ncbi:hypothetical protein E4U32_008129 [Claviceps aff. humidiphila group G2b]|nr:hypothetical protein E4U32_008129 [Claviceps aff. humidiphila group G2b]
MGYWTAALNGESPACPTEEEHVRLCRLPNHYVYVVKTPKTQRQTSYAIQRAVASWYDSTETPQQKTKTRRRTKRVSGIFHRIPEDLDYKMTKEERPEDWSSIIGASKIDRHEPINAVEAAKEEVLTQTTQQPFVASTFVRLAVETIRPV